MISRRSLLTAAVAAAATGGLAACAKDGGGTNTGNGNGKITLGFSQTGSESGWRTANTKSIQESATAAGIDLKFSDAQGKEENQIAAVRSFIQQKVDVISFSPLKVTGWDTVLKEAKAANIPVILTDRGVEADASLYVSLLGSDFTEEGKRAAVMFKEICKDMAAVNIAQLEGSTGSAPAIERTKGFAEAIASETKFKIVVTQTGEFTRSKGKEVMEAFLKSHPEINALYAQNDDMGLGAIQAIEAAGKKPGTDIRIVTVDAIKDGMTALAAGKINGIVECNPLLGPQLMEMVKKVKAGQTVEKRIITIEKDFYQKDAAAALPTRQY
ncbi:ABC transporter substrate-binding protein [Allorhizocola rhizosphaerae]|uniref:ABC transporter substrate-binding protein n=1 Tax=Allorhizocola rhizosphaerae TaxID=1872709 RepID=UPI000E3D3D58|nr:ABC transporter substrate-binding protein [Allorhizocola rhizosphaerae]